MKQKLEAEAILQKLAELRKQLPGIEDMPRSHGASDGRLMLPDDIPAETEEDFEWAAVIDGLHAFAADLSAVKERARARAIEAAPPVMIR